MSQADAENNQNAINTPNSFTISVQANAIPILLEKVLLLIVIKFILLIYEHLPIVT